MDWLAYLGIAIVLGGFLIPRDAQAGWIKWLVVALGAVLVVIGANT